MALKTITDSNIHFAFSPLNKPILEVSDGETVIFNCRDCYDKQVEYDNFDYKKIDRGRINPATGPLYIKNAQKGDLLKIEICSIEIAAKGVTTTRENDGAYVVKGFHCRLLTVKDNKVKIDEKTSVPIKPMIGVIGVAPESGEVSTHDPGEHGGNLDVKDITAGSVLYLPVNVPGALLSMGDLHAVMGDGETSSCGLEICGDVKVKVTVVKNRKLPTPFIETADSYITTAAAESLDECSIEACRKMQRFLMNEYGMDDVKSSILLGLAGNLRISQIVNPLKGCIMEISKSLL